MCVCETCVSSTSLEVGDDIGSVFRVGDASEGHSVTWCETRRALEPLVQISICPFDCGLG